MYDEVQAWLIEVDWPAKPVKPIGSDAWMIGSEVRFESEWAFMEQSIDPFVMVSSKES